MATTFIVQAPDGSEVRTSLFADAKAKANANHGTVYSMVNVYQWAPPGLKFKWIAANNNWQVYDLSGVYGTTDINKNMIWATPTVPLMNATQAMELWVFLSFITVAAEGKNYIVDGRSINQVATLP